MKLPRFLGLSFLLLTGTLASACGSAPIGPVGSTSASLTRAIPIHTFAASSDVRRQHGITTWKTFRGSADTIVTGYDANGAAVRGVRFRPVAHHGASAGYFDIQFLDRSHAHLRIGTDLTMRGEGVTSEHLALMKSIKADLGRAAALVPGAAGSAVGTAAEIGIASYGEPECGGAVFAIAGAATGCAADYQECQKDCEAVGPEGCVVVCPVAAVANDFSPSIDPYSCRDIVSTAAGVATSCNLPSLHESPRPCEQTPLDCDACPAASECQGRCPAQGPLTSYECRYVCAGNEPRCQASAPPPANPGLYDAMASGSPGPSVAPGGGGLSADPDTGEVSSAPTDADDTGAPVADAPAEEPPPPPPAPVEGDDAVDG